jgi:hypothetical protein
VPTTGKPVFFNNCPCIPMTGSINNMDVCVRYSLFSRTTRHRINNLHPMITEHQLYTNQWVCTHGMGKTTVRQRYTAVRGGNYIKVEIFTSADIYFIQIKE